MGKDQKQQRHEAKAQVQAEQPASGAVAEAKREGPLPLSLRSIDAWLALWFVIFAFTTTFTDLHNFTASLMGVEVKDLEGMTLMYPPKFLTDIYFKWARTVDPLLYENPVWWQCIEWVNLLALTPFALVLGPIGFWRGAAWVRIPAIVISSFTFYSLILCIGTTLFGPVKSADPGTFTGIYIIYLTQPAVVLARLWADKPFARISPTKNAVLVFLTVVNLAVFASYVVKWFVLYEPGMLGPALPFLQGAAKLP